ncbi:MAG: LysR family transcriptional regulator [Rhodoferax sp.]|uniref:LysR family transcriptional regulator n=1 Tax=Rhodoferax sp. TaxID=50421 RepID=UPI001B668529|nr:LysR family transcriptional regulator [Rhodoferax sp.]MBP9906605.1 LysR family transcriptional regulator [Rhodoferax sp.]
MRRKIPSLQALACFEAAARHQSYTRAAQELALTQGAVSRQLTALEEFVGVTLFTRTRHGVALTERGRDYAAQVAIRLRALEQDTLDVMSLPGKASVLHLAAVPTFATRWLIPRLPDLKRQQPDLSLHIETRTRAFMFADTPFDAALFAGTPEQVSQWAGTRAVKLLDEVVLPVCAPQWLQGTSGLPAQAIAQLPLLQQSTRIDAWRQWFEAQGVAAPQAMAGERLELFSMTIAAAVHGMGLALVPKLLVTDELARGDLMVACDQALSSKRAYYLVWPERVDSSPATQVFLDWLMQAVSAEG